MRHLLMLLVVFTAVNSVNAQDPILFENDWFLIDLRVAGEDVAIPVNSEMPNVPLNFFVTTHPDDWDVYSSACNDIYLYIDEYTANTMELTFATITLGECDFEENTGFEFKYFQFFDSTVTSGEPLNYFFDIVDSPSGTSGPEEGDLLGLRLEQSSGDFAYYINAKLQVDDFSLARIELFPNPATNFLNINYSGGLDLSARIFTIDG